MAVTLREVAEWIQGDLVGDPEQVIAAARPLRDAGPGDITFVEDEKYLSAFNASGASAAIVSPTLAAHGKSLIRVKDPLMSFIAALRKLDPPPEAAFIGTHVSAQIHPSARIGKDVAIGPFVVVGQDAVIGDACALHAGAVVGNFCRLGDGVVLFPHAVLYDGCILGDRVIIHANAVIGADGYGYRKKGGRHVKVPQLGHVEIGDDVEIGAGTTIDRGTFGATRIGEGTKIDNMVMVGHNCRIGRHNLLCSQVGIAGSVTTGDDVIMAGQVGIADHVIVGDRSAFGAKAGVHKDVPADVRMLGAPAAPAREQMRVIMALERLPEMLKEIRRIKQFIGLKDAEKGAA